MSPWWAVILSMWWFRHRCGIVGLMQERRNSNANALELRLACTNLSIWWMIRNTFTGKVTKSSWSLWVPYPWSVLFCCLSHCMMTSSNGNIFHVTGPLCGECTDPGEFPAQRPVTRSIDIFFHLRLNKRLSKQSRGRWFETPPWSLWRQCNGLMDTSSTAR